MKGLDEEVMNDVGHFFRKVNDRSLYNLGINDSYDDGGDAALGLTVEYFHPAITLDDRMRYIAENIVYNKNLSPQSIVCNTILSHFYGARGIHQVITRDKDPKTALVDFDRYLKDEKYKNELSRNLKDATGFGIPIYGTTELRTSIFGAANAFVANKYNRAKDKHPANILRWIADFIDRGIVDQMLAANSLEELYKVLIQLEGIGAYYGYHCSTSNSVNPLINVNHDERFCVPGPGARYTLGILFDQSSTNLDFGEQVVWFRENYKDYIGDIVMHDTTHNIIVDGKKVFADEQDELKTYGSEVGLCQYGVYKRLKENPKLINRRKVSRLDEDIAKKYFDGESPQTNNQLTLF